MDTYQEDQINELSVTKTDDGSLLVTVIPMLETLYACPGVLIKEENDAIMIEFVRCNINTTCHVDAEAAADSNNPGSYKITLPDKGKPIKINYSTGAVKIWPNA